MALNIRPLRSTAHLPRMGSYQNALNARRQAVFGTTRTFGQQQFQEPDAPIYIQGGRANIQGGDLVSEFLKTPGRILEAPLRPFNVLSDNAIGEALGGFWQGLKDVPVLGLAAQGLEAGVGVLEAENKAVRATMNRDTASVLRESIGKSPSEIIRLPDGNQITVGEFRQDISARWGVNEYTGEQLSLEQLEQMALDDLMGFGEFKTNDNGFFGFVQETLASPSTYLLGTGLITKALRGTAMTVPAIRSGTAAIQSARGASTLGQAVSRYNMASRPVRIASWASRRPSALSRAAQLPRIGQGARAAIRGDWVPAPIHSTVRNFLDSRPGQLGALPVRGLLMAGSKLYFPGYQALRRPTLAQLTAQARRQGITVEELFEQGARVGRGYGPLRAGTIAYTRGGIQQMLATTGAQTVLDLINEREYDESGATPVGPPDGFFDTMQDLLHAVNNNHPLSDNATYTLVALFSPWASAIGSVRGGLPKIERPQEYYNNALMRRQQHMSDLTGTPQMSESELLKYIGDGDEALGRRIVEWNIDLQDVLSVGSELSVLTRGTVSVIESITHRHNFMNRIVRDKVARLRASGGLRPKLNAEFSVDRYREGYLNDPQIKLTRQNRQITWEGYWEGMRRQYLAMNELVAKLGPTRAIQVTDGAPITRELAQGLRSMLDQLDDADIIPREVAALIIERHPALMHASGFWEEFAITLGQRMERTGLLRGERKDLPTEGVTVGELKQHMDELIPELPTFDELYHEQLIAERRALQDSEVTTVVSREASTDMPARMRSYRDRFVTSARHSFDLRSKISQIRGREFNRNGTPKFGTAKVLRDHFGGEWRQVGNQEGVYQKEPVGRQISFPRNPNARITLSDGAEISVIDMLNYVQPDPSDPSMVGRPQLFASQAQGTTVADRDFVIFRPAPEQMYPIASDQGLAYITSKKMKDNRWYILDEETGQVLSRVNYPSVRAAVRALHRQSEEQLTVQITNTGVIKLGGRLPPYIQEPPMARVLAEEFSENYAEILAFSFTRVQNERPNTIVGQGGPGLYIDDNGGSHPTPSSRLGSRHYYYIGDDGSPAGLLHIDLVDGKPEGVNVYVDPEYRMSARPDLNVRNRLYDQAFRDGYDLAPISGRINTPAGRKATDRYWKTRRNSFDTGQLQLAVENGGRIIELSQAQIAEHASTLARWGFHEVARYPRPKVVPVRLKQTTAFLDDAETTIPVSESYSVVVDDVEYSIIRPAHDAREIRRGEVLDPEDVNYGLEEEFIQRYTAGNYYVRPIDRTNPRVGWMTRSPYPAFGTLEVAIEHLVGPVPEMAVFAYRGGDITQALLNSIVDGAQRPYTPTNRRVKGQVAAFNLARKRANDASLTYPTLDTLGQGYTNSRKFFNPTERRQHLTELMGELDAKAKSSAESIQWFDDTVDTVIGLKKVTHLDQWFERALPEEINSLVDTVKDFNQRYPGLTLSDASFTFDPRSSRFGHLTTAHSLLGRAAYEYGFLSPLTRVFDIFEANSQSWIARKMYLELNTQLSLSGLNNRQVDAFYHGIRDRIQRTREVEGIEARIGAYMTRNARAIPEPELRAILRDAAGQDKLDAVLSRFNSVHRLLTETANPLLRRSAQRERHGGKVGALESAMNAFARSWQYDPALRGFSRTTNRLTKFYYPLIRFKTDPLFVAMNLMEPYMYGISRHGVSNAIRKRSPYQQRLNERVYEQMQRSGIPAEGLTATEKLPISVMLQDSGIFTMPVNIRGQLLKDYEVVRLESLMDELKSIPDNEPLAQMFQERFGKMDGDNWARGMEDVAFGFLDESIEGMTRKEFQQYFDELGFTQDDMQLMVPFVERVSEMYRKMADDLQDLYIGRMRRNTVERIMDHFFLFWPLSYMIKATTWMAQIMFKRVGGMNIGAGGAYLYSEYRERFMRAVENDSDLQEWLENNRDWLFLLEMLFPLTPESIGVSLSAPSRIAASWVNANTMESPELTELFGDYSYIESVPEAIERTIRFGPIRTWNFAQRLMNSMDVPGWTYEDTTFGNASEVISDRGARLP